MDDRDGVVFVVGANPGEDVIHLIGDAEPEDLHVEVDHPRDVRRGEGHVVNADRAHAAAASLTGAIDVAVELDPVAIGVRERDCPGVVAPGLLPAPVDAVNVQSFGEPVQCAILGLHGKVIETLAIDELDGVVTAPPAESLLASRTGLGSHHPDDVGIEAGRSFEARRSQAQVGDRQRIARGGHG